MFAQHTMSIFDEMASDSAELLREFGKQITWNGNEYSALVSEPTIAQEFDVGGFVDSVDFVAKLLRNDLIHGLPEHGELVTYNGEEYRIMRLSNRPPHPFVVLTLAAKDE
jgi:hypothetical protein